MLAMMPAGSQETGARHNVSGTDEQSAAGQAHLLQNLSDEEVVGAQQLLPCSAPAPSAHSPRTTTVPHSSEHLASARWVR